MRILARFLGKIRFRLVQGTRPCLFPNLDVIITTYADLNNRVGETVAVRGELKRQKLPSVLGVDGGHSLTRRLVTFATAKTSGEVGIRTLDYRIIDRNGFRCVGQVDRFKFAISGTDGGWTSLPHEAGHFRGFGLDTSTLTRRNLSFGLGPRHVNSRKSAIDQRNPNVDRPTARP